MKTKSFYSLSSLEFTNTLLKELRVLGEPITRPQPVGNHVVMNKAINKLLDTYPDCPLTADDIKRMWNLHSKVRRLKRPLQGCEFLVRPLVTLNMPVSREFKQEIELVRHYLYEVVVSLHTALLHIGSLLKLPNTNERAYSALRGDIKEYKKFITDTAPYSICPYCKAIDWYQERCEVCCGQGWVDYRTYNEAPEMLRTDKAVAFEGRFIDIPAAIEKRNAEQARMGG
jgi:hypothetical protein